MWAEFEPTGVRECCQRNGAAADSYALAVKNSCLISRIVVEMYASTREASDIRRPQDVPQRSRAERCQSRGRGIDRRPFDEYQVQG